jgi:hypothetical protein
VAGGRRRGLEGVDRQRDLRSALDPRGRRPSVQHRVGVRCRRRRARGGHAAAKGAVYAAAAGGQRPLGDFSASRSRRRPFSTCRALAGVGRRCCSCRCRCREGKPTAAGCSTATATVAPPVSRGDSARLRRVGLSRGHTRCRSRMHRRGTSTGSA